MVVPVVVFVMLTAIGDSADGPAPSPIGGVEVDGCDMSVWWRRDWPAGC